MRPAYKDILLVGSILSQLTLFGQNNWAKSIGGLGGDQVNDVKVGPDGFVYVIGEFSAGMDVDGQPMNSVGGTDCFVAKLDDFGHLVWIKRAGGGAIDRGLKLAVDANGTLAVAGQFMGTANLFGTTYQSAGGTQDMFVAKLSTATGDAAWVRVGGSATGSDSPNGVAISPNGAITVAGEFRGDAMFNGSSLNSMVDPNTLQPSIDVFIASYAADGSPLWLQHGAAKYTDRAIDVVSDANNNLYVCGQFSDTVTFDAVHNNAMYNATFLLKLDAAGNEQWFRRCGGAMLDQVHDMQLTSTNELLLCGDLQGTMVYEDATPHIIPGGDPYAYYLLRVGLNGSYIAHSVMGSENPVSARSLDQRADTIAVYGEFHCQFTGLSTHYNGDGLFMATGDDDLFICKHRSSSLQFQEAQQFGGKHEKHAGGIASLDNGDLVFGGGYVFSLVFPSNVQAFWGNWPYACGSSGCFFVGPGNCQPYCADSSYGQFAVDKSAGLLDGFVARGYARGRLPYDMWKRQDSIPCEFGRGKPCIHEDLTNNCPDTVWACDGLLYVDILGLRTPFAWQGNSCIGFPDLDISFGVDALWSNGSTDFTTQILGTGWVWCRISTRNGCWSWTDSVYVANEVLPCPEVSDGQGVNVATCTPQDLTCVPPTWLWCPNVPPGYSFEWGLNGYYFDGDSIFADVSGIYRGVLVSPHGCYQSREFAVAVNTDVPMVNITSLALACQDTVFVCEGDCGYLTASPTWAVDGVETSLPAALHILELQCNTTYRVDSGNVQELVWSFTVGVSGWYSVNTSISVTNAPCLQDTLVFPSTHMVYVNVISYPVVDLAAPETICPGDTLPVVAICSNCWSMSWGGPGITSISDDQLTAWIDMDGLYVFGAVNMLGGVSCQAPFFFNVAPPAIPELLLTPQLICPGDSAWLSTTLQGTNYQWLGPNGPIGVDSNLIHIGDFGDYYLTMTDTNGCELTNGPITLNAFGTPYLDVQPDYILCPYGSITIEVQTNDPQSIVWNAPLFGSDTLQVITQPGLYSCSATSCDIVNALSVYIIGGNPNAQILSEGPLAFCEGDSVHLTGVAGQAIYLWQPGDLFTDNIWVGSSGDYQLIALDEFGCSDTSAVDITVASTAPLNLGQDTSLCAGSSVMLHVPDGYTNVHWSNGASSQTITVDQPGTYTVEVTDSSGCNISAQVIIDLGGCDEYVPNIITPNGDGQNDSWTVVGFYCELNATIFGRWGEKIYENDPQRTPWNGKNMNGENVPDGVYYYIVNTKRTGQEPKVYSGYLQVRH